MNGAQTLNAWGRRVHRAVGLDVRQGVEGVLRSSKCPKSGTSQI